ncbi:MAG: hypothetical protein ABI054_00365 [Planctomycetota bacterium]|nr:hypothetical protein [Planctomycetota bacterium]
MTQNFEKLGQTFEAARDDMAKAEAGNKAACARVRKTMQDIKNLAQEIRKEMLELRDAGGKPAAPPAKAPAKPGGMGGPGGGMGR